MVDHPVSILIVEDNHIVRKISVTILEKLLCQVDAADCGRTALDYAKRNTYDMILMDIGLPDISGLDVTKTIRTEEGFNKDAPIVVLTAHSDEEHLLMSKAVGATDFYVKPFSEELGKSLLNKYVS